MRYDEANKPAISNLLTIYALCTGLPIPEIEARYAGKGYGAFKADLAEAVIAELAPIQQRLDDLTANPDAVIQQLRVGAERARAMASAKMARVRDVIGVGLPQVGAPVGPDGSR